MELSARLMNAPLLVASTTLLFLGLSWAAFELCWNHPWLLLIGASLVCLLAHCWQAVRIGGLLSLLPLWVTDTLQRPAFELVRSGGVIAVLSGGNFLRLLLLAVGDLDERQQAQVLAELSKDYRQKCFQHPCVELLPQRLKQLLTGEQQIQSCVVDDCNESFPLLSTPSPSLHNGSEGPSVSDLTSPTSKVEELLDQIRGVEGAARSVETQMLQKVLNEKISDIAMTALRQGGLHQVRPPLKGAKDKLAPLKEASLARVETTLCAASSAWSRAQSLAWAALSLPWRLTIASTTLSLQSIGSLATAARQTSLLALRLSILSWASKAAGSPQTSASGGIWEEAQAASEFGMSRCRTSSLEEMISEIRPRLVASQS